VPVEPFVDFPEPSDPTVAIWRFVAFWKLQDLLKSGQLYFRRADLLNDEHEGLPPAEYEHILKLSKYELGDIAQRDNDIGALAQFRQAFYVNCWHLHTEETARMWAQYGKDGVAIVSRYELLKRVLDPLCDRVLVVPIRYGTAHLTGWNLIRFVTTKREEYSPERELRAMIWLTGSGDPVNRHFDSANRPHDRPLHDPPPTFPVGIRRHIDFAALITDVVVSPWAPASRLAETSELLANAAVSGTVRASSLTPYSSLIPTEDDLSRFMP
jgi:hypothetical protein